MQRLLLVIAAAAGIGAVANLAGLLPSGLTVAELGQSELGNSLAAGLILGSNVWPYAANPAPLDLTSALLQSPDCDTPGQCGMYGLASATFIGSQPDTPDNTPDTLDTE